MEREKTGVQRPAAKSQGQLGDVSEQEALMTASAVPPGFALTASAVGGDGDGDAAPLAVAAARLGLVESDVEGLDEGLLGALADIGGRFSQRAWNALRAVCGGAFEEVLRTFYLDMAWVLSPEAEVLDLVGDAPYRSAAGWKNGSVEVVRYAGAVGMRAVIPYTGFGGNVILRPDGTATVVGRSVESVQREEFRTEMNQPRGTNYMRFQENMAVGKNVGGGDVLDVLDKEWSWPLNNAWLQAAIDRRDPIRFVSDPASPRTLFKGGGTIEDGLTVTGSELGVLLHRGFAPNLGSGVVGARFVPGDGTVAENWNQAENSVVSSGKVDEMDRDAYSMFMEGSKECARTPKVYCDPDGNIVEVQSNFFGGGPGQSMAA